MPAIGASGRASWAAAIAAATAVCALAAPLPADGREVVGLIGGVAGGEGGSFREPSDVAVYHGDVSDPHDDKIFVAEAARGRNSRVQRLDAHGNFELMWGRDVVRAGVRGDRGTGFEVCRRALSGARGCKAAPPGTGAGELDMPMAIAVSQTAGRVYVLDQRNRRVQEFDLGGRFVRAWGWAVRTGAAAFEVCEAGCRAGRVGGGEGDANAGQIATASAAGLPIAPGGGIAVSPLPPHRVFVGDPGNRRVLEFGAGGDFVRGWGWGVAGDGRGFQTCTGAQGCQRGRRTGRPGALALEAWPRHLAVGPDGVVYGAELTSNDRTIRFASAPAPDGSDAAGALLPPLPGDGETLGLEVAAGSGRVLVARNPFGPSVVEEWAVRASSEGGRGARRVRVDDVGFVYSAHGLGLTHGAGNVYLPINRALEHRDPGTTFSSCASVRGFAPCHGLAVIGAGGAAAATATAATGLSSPAARAVVAPGGLVHYRLQATTDGRRWRTLGAPRYAAGDAPVSLDMALRGLRRPALYGVRLQVARADGQRPRWTASNEWVVSLTR